MVKMDFASGSNHAVAEAAQTQSTVRPRAMNREHREPRLKLRRGLAQSLLDFEERQHAEYFFGEKLWRLVRERAEAESLEFRALVRELVESALFARTTWRSPLALAGNSIGSSIPLGTVQRRSRRLAAPLVWPIHQSGHPGPRKRTFQAMSA